MGVLAQAFQFDRDENDVVCDDVWVVGNLIRKRPTSDSSTVPLAVAMATVDDRGRIFRNNDLEHKLNVDPVSKSTETLMPSITPMIVGTTGGDGRA